MLTTLVVLVTLTTLFGDIDDVVSQRDAPLSDTLLEAEVLANVLTDPAVLASGIFYDVEQFTSSDGT